MILNPKGEVRFASPEKWVGRLIDLSSGELCPACGGIDRATQAAIRNPLASIHYSLHGLCDALLPLNQPTVSSHLKIIEDEINSCVSVTDRLLRLSEPPCDVLELVSFNDVVAGVMSLLNAEAERTRVNIVIALAERLRVLASDNDMRMLVLNIAQNAFHAMPNGGHLYIAGLIVGSNVELSFEDTGVGIRPEHMRIIFEPFWSRRADGVRGTGLGLAICREIVKRYGGKIAVSSEVGRGTRFKISLPSADAANELGTEDGRQTEQANSPH